MNLRSLKPNIREAVAAEWIESVSDLRDRIKEKIADDVPETSLLGIVKTWNDPTNRGSISESWQTWVQETQQSNDKATDAVRAWDFGKSDDFQKWIREGNRNQSNSGRANLPSHLPATRQFMGSTRAASTRTYFQQTIRYESPRPTFS